VLKIRSRSGRRDLVSRSYSRSGGKTLDRALRDTFVGCSYVICPGYLGLSDLDRAYILVYAGFVSLVALWALGPSVATRLRVGGHRGARLVVEVVMTALLVQPAYWLGRAF
jgi:hypothetical protein